jgi:hypothetical protein
MRNPHRRLTAITRTVLVVAAVLSLTTTSEAQFGGLKKKLKAAAAQQAVGEATQEAAGPAAEPAGPTGGATKDAGMIVLTDEVLDKLIAGLEAAEAERKAADAADTPYGRYKQGRLAYDKARPKCEQARQTFLNRLATDEKLSAKYNVLVQKMVDAQGRGDQAAVAAYNDSTLIMQDASCGVKEPQLPDDFYETHREVNNRAEQAAMKKSGFSRSELSQVRERAELVLRQGTPPSDLSPSEKAALDSRAPQLKPLLGIDA